MYFERYTFSLNVAGIGKLYDFTVTSDAIQWSVPDTLQGCIMGYQYTFEDSDIAYLHSDENIIPLISIRYNYCDRPITVYPIIAARSKPLHTSGITSNICVPRPGKC